MSGHVVMKSIKIKAEPEKIWNALTDPDKTKKYFFNAKVLSDWKQGSQIIFKGKLFWVIPFEMTGTIIRVEPGKYLQYTLKNGKKEDAKAGFSTVTDVLTYDNGITTLSVTDDVGDGEGAYKRMERSQKGWDKVLSGLKKLVEEGRVKPTDFLKITHGAIFP